MTKRNPPHEARGLRKCDLAGAVRSVTTPRPETQAVSALPLFATGEWREVRRCDHRAVAIVDRHYSRQTVGAAEFMPPGETLVLLTHDEGAVWGACLNLDPVGALRWRVTVFRREHGALASILIREATELTFARWRERGGLPDVPLTTEVDPRRTRPKRDPGRCFLRAGWRVLDRDRNGLVVLTVDHE